MKTLKLKITATTFVCSILFFTNIFSQPGVDWQLAGNNIAGTEYLGGDPTSTIPLELKTITPYDINFYTDFGTVPTPRVTIEGINSTGFVGIATTTPSTSLEINSGLTTGNVPPRLTAGLRFTQLTSTSAATDDIPAHGRALTVDPNGEVGLISCIPANVCGPGNGIINYLRSDWEIPLSDPAGAIGNTFYFSSDGLFGCSDNVGIGMKCQRNNPIAKLHVSQPAACPNAIGFAYSIAGQFDNITAGGISGIGVEANVIRTSVFNYGVLGYVPLPNIFGGATSYAIYGDLGLAGPPCALLPCPPSGDFAGYFNGDVLSTTGNFLPSDANLKTNIQDLQNPMSILNQLHPKTYNYNQAGNPSMRLPDGPHVGVLAQDLETVLPALVKDCVHPSRHDSLGNETFAAINFKAVNSSAR